MKNRHLRLGRTVVLGISLLVVAAILVLALLAARQLGTQTTSGASLRDIPQPVKTVMPAVNPTLQPRPQEPASTPPRVVVVKEHDFGTWRYKVTRPDVPGATQSATMHGRITYDSSSIAALKAFAAETHRLAASLAADKRPAQVEVTFNSYLQIDQYRKWVAKTGFVPEIADVRFVDQTGQRWGGGVSPEGNEVAPAYQLDMASRGLSNLSLKGVYAVRGSIPADRLAAIVSDPTVFLADVTPTIVRRELEQQLGGPVPSLNILVETPFWQMEDFGLQNFK
jgi:hypothetical protein